MAFYKYLHLLKYFTLMSVTLCTAVYLICGSPYIQWLILVNTGLRAGTCTQAMSVLSVSVGGHVLAARC